MKKLYFVNWPRLFTEISKSSLAINILGSFYSPKIFLYRFTYSKKDGFLLTPPKRITSNSRFYFQFSRWELKYKNDLANIFWSLEEITLWLLVTMQIWIWLYKLPYLLVLVQLDKGVRLPEDWYFIIRKKFLSYYKNLYIF